MVRDSRVNSADNETFLNLMERYFEQPEEVKLADARPQFHYQVNSCNISGTFSKSLLPEVTI